MVGGVRAVLPCVTPWWLPPCTSSSFGARRDHRCTPVEPRTRRVSRWPFGSVPLVLAVFGLGMTLGMPVGGRLVDWSVRRSVVIGLTGMMIVLATLPLAAPSGVAMPVWIFLLAFTPG
jgi:predicted MFS family arabinose efflux permease